jgi:hypothetical protein
MTLVLYSTENVPARFFILNIITSIGFPNIYNKTLGKKIENVLGTFYVDEFRECAAFFLSQTVQYWLRYDGPKDRPAK